MNLNQLKLFYLAVKGGSASAAAEKLNITQPAVSKGIRRFEEYYEVELVKRSGRKIELTEAGRELFRIAERIFELEMVAEDRLQNFMRSASRRIIIDSSETFGAYYLPSCISLFNSIHPRVEVVVDIHPNRDVIKRTLSLKNDLGFVSCRVSEPRLLPKAIVQDDPVLIVPKNHPIAGKKRIKPDDLADETMILHEEGSVFQEAIKRLVSERDLGFLTPITLANNEAIKRAVINGSGIALISKKAVENEIKTDKIKAFHLPFFDLSRSFFLIQSSQKQVKKHVADFLEIMESFPF